MAGDPCPVSENVRGHENIEWSTAYAFHLTDAQRNLPRVLLVGDSICNGYQGAVQKRLEGKVNVSYWVSSYCVTSPNYLKLLEVYLAEAPYDVVHFNNGLHSLGTKPDDWEKGLRAALALVRARQPKARIVWVSSTPLKDPALTAKVKELNARGAKVAADFTQDTDDLFALLDPLDRAANWTDTFHHKAPVREREAGQVAASVLAALPQTLPWKVGAYASRTGNIVKVNIPAGRAASGNVMLAYDLSPFDGKAFEATIRARARRLSKPSEAWLGFKFMMAYQDAGTGHSYWPGAPQRVGDFDWQTVRIVDSLTDVKRFKGALTLGIQDATGEVEFDLSSFRIHEMPELWPKTNLTLRCAYTPAVADRPPCRGVMLGHGLKEDDFRVLHDWGVTLARFQMTRDWNTVGGNRDLPDYDRYIDGELDSLEKHLAWAKKYGIRIVVDLHAAPGARDERHDLYMCHDRKYADHFIATWRRIAMRFKGRPEIYGFDLVNEPQQLSPALPGCDYWSLQSRAAEAIRAIDPETPVIIESNCYDGPGTFSYMYPLDLTNIIYQVHMYVPMEFTHQQVFSKTAPRTVYPDAKRGWNIDFLRTAMKPVIAFQKRHGAKIYVGEFSAIVWGQGAGDYIRDCISVFEENRWDWTFHAFREWSGWSVEYEAKEPWAQVPSQDNPRKRALLEGFRR